MTALLRGVARAVVGIFERRRRQTCRRCGARDDLAQVAPDSVEMLCQTCFCQDLGLISLDDPPGRERE